ncbi:MAG: hypothetical protein KF802_03675 [Bdellovibrionaceae bacterium]|nr:hypothetical protein [Pseudobdellovibrionaceae bacterium]MBX3033278.1 hypothetical protein [Pseudobdellovibrionaceae bacterium]
MGRRSSPLATALPPAAEAVASLQPKSFLWSESLDGLGTGIASLVLFALAFCLIDKQASTNSVGWTAYYLGFLVNWPHFAMSYQLLYGRARESWRDPHFLWAAAICPLALVMAFAAIFVQAETKWMAWMTQAMYFFVGWHYAKQTFGITLVSCHVKKYRLSAAFKNSIKFNLLALWMMNWISLNTTLSAYDNYGFSYTQLGFPQPFAWIAQAAFVGSLAMVLLQGLRHYFATGETPPKAALGSWLAMMVWYIPAMHHPVMFLFIPFFHSLQYILFVAVYRRGKVHHEETARPVEAPVARRRTFRRHVLFFAFSAVAGYLMFEGIPLFLDGRFPQEHFGKGQFFMASFVLFINIHHYFIDNVIWRRGFGDMQTYLTQEAR